MKFIRQKVIAGKQSELRFSEVDGVREEVNEIIRSIKEILQGYVNDLEKTRATFSVTKNDASKTKKINKMSF